MFKLAQDEKFELFLLKLFAVFLYCYYKDIFDIYFYVYGLSMKNKKTVGDKFRPVLSMLKTLVLSQVKPENFMRD